jgi:hypothetical protein
LANGRVHVGSGDGKLYTFDAAGVTNCSGNPVVCNPLWTATLDDWTMASPAVSDGRVYIPTTANTLFVFDAAGTTNCAGSPKVCTPLWTAAAGAGDISPVVSGGRVYMGGELDLEVFDAAGIAGCSGTPKVCSPLWTAPLSGVGTSPAVANGRVYVASVSGSSDLVAFDANGVTNCVGTPAVCSPLWWTALAGSNATGPTVANGVVYVGVYNEDWGNARMPAYDAAGSVNCSGTPTYCTRLWPGDIHLDSFMLSTPVIWGGHVYATVLRGLGGRLHVYSPA